MAKPASPNGQSAMRGAMRRPGPEGGKRRENRKRRTGDLLASALDLFVERGLEAVTIDDIVGAAGIAKGSFYRYFDDKSDLVVALFEPVRAKLREAASACDASLRAASEPAELFAAYTALSLELAALASERPKLVRLYLQECRGPARGARAPIAALASDIRAAAIDLTLAAHTRGLLRPIDPRVSALAVVGAVERLAYAHLSGEPLGEPDTIAAGLIALVLDGIRPRD